jgi:hypothetical protein
MSLRDFLRRIRGIDTPLGGVSWEPPVAARKVVHRFLERMADRRFIYRTHGGFKYALVVESLKTMRNEVSEALGELQPDVRGRDHLISIRSALHAFQTFLESEYPDAGTADLNREVRPTDALPEALMEFRDKMSQLMTALGDEYGLEIVDGLRWDLRKR